MKYILNFVLVLVGSCSYAVSFLKYEKDLLVGFVMGWSVTRWVCIHTQCLGNMEAELFCNEQLMGFFRVFLLRDFSFFTGFSMHLDM